MRLRKVEDKGSLSVKELFDTVVGSLKKYILMDSSELNSVLEDWEYTVDAGESQAVEEIIFNIPVTLDSDIDILLGSKLRCEVDSSFDLSGTIHLQTESGAFRLLVTLPFISSLMDYFCNSNAVFPEDDPFEVDIRDASQANKFASDCKSYLDTYTKNLKTVFDSLKKMDDLSYNITKIIQSEP